MLVCGTAFQCMSGRLGIITGRDLAQHCGQQYGRFARLLLWVLIEIAIIGADVQETVGCAQALHLLSQSKIPLWAGACGRWCAWCSGVGGGCQGLGPGVFLLGMRECNTWSCLPAKVAPVCGACVVIILVAAVLG